MRMWPSGRAPAFQAGEDGFDSRHALLIRCRPTGGREPLELAMLVRFQPPELIFPLGPMERRPALNGQIEVRALEGEPVPNRCALWGERSRPHRREDHCWH